MFFLGLIPCEYAYVGPMVLLGPNPYFKLSTSAPLPSRRDVMGGIGLTPGPCSTLEYQRRKTKFLVIHVEQEAQQGSADLGADILQFSPCVIYKVLFGSIFPMAFWVSDAKCQ